MLQRPPEEGGGAEAAHAAPEQRHREGEPREREGLRDRVQVSNGDSKSGVHATTFAQVVPRPEIPVAQEASTVQAGADVADEGGWSEAKPKAEKGRTAVKAKAKEHAAAGAPGSGQKQHFEYYRAFVASAGGDGDMSWRDGPVLDRHFSQFGWIMDVFLPKGKKIAYIAFETEQQLERAVLHVPHVVSGCKLRVTRSGQVPALRSKP
jgi:hypothetical protein